MLRGGMDVKLYVSREGRTIGPVSLDDARLAMANERMMASDLVSVDGQTWRRADEVDALADLLRVSSDTSHGLASASAGTGLYSVSSIPAPGGRNASAVLLVVGCLALIFPLAVCALGSCSLWILTGGSEPVQDGDTFVIAPAPEPAPSRCLTRGSGASVETACILPIGVTASAIPGVESGTACGRFVMRCLNVLREERSAPVCLTTAHRGAGVPVAGEGLVQEAWYVNVDAPGFQSLLLSGIRANPRLRPTQACSYGFALSERYEDEG